jgi:hypothetical protein
MGNHGFFQKENEKKEKTEIKKIEYNPIINEEYHLLNQNIIKQINNKLPFEKKNQKELFLLYSSKRDGYSIDSFHHKTMNKGIK